MKAISLMVVIFFCSFLSSCEGCSRSGRKLQTRPSGTRSIETNVRSRADGKLIIPMVKKNGVYEIPVTINGSSMNFIFDTGASDITISAVEALFLVKQGTLAEEDVMGTQQYQIADGSISEGTIINLKTVQLGDRTLYNVKASVVHNMNAPLLFGQSALAQFGKISIDYNRHEIIFE